MIANFTSCRSGKVFFSMPTPTAILIAGPTASGKSGLAMAFAQKLDGVVINADSMQVYRELRVLTARPSVGDEAAIPHKLYGHVAGADAYSTGRYVRDAAVAIAQVHGTKKVPVIVGGTGLYFRALLQGLSPIPPVPGDVRAHWRQEARRLGPAGLHALLAASDPVMAAKLLPSDPQRVTRALEVLEATGVSLGQWQQAPGVPILNEAQTLRLVIVPDRDVSRQHCDARFDVMMGEGALDEVRDLRALGLSGELPVMRALGVVPLGRHLAGQLSRDVAVEQAKAETRQYVKRQSTWLRRNMNTWNVITPQQMECSEDLIVSLIDS